MSNLYTTPEAARETGIPEGTIRSWLTRKRGEFLIDTHIVIEEGTGRKLWTEVGLELLRSRAGNPSDEEITSEEPEDFDNLVLDPIVEATTERLAIRYFQLLPARTIARIQQMLTNPTPEERELVETSIQNAIAAGTHHLLNSQTRRLSG
ncbi:hypothetical protein BV372_08115 [Nostoc sp. T09]|uniref:hypothetical protein n=1 Tax=Nostoc sp. T09 TaxID=1932621 RepID=UPI000A3AB70C|nr:hypothetical protein [Nostoc sp. T09]OUL36372.1 hypothetical protein BV372_08115 [Nostoc sp. T09]